MNLRQTIHDLRLREIDAMNALQDAGVISDLCVSVDDAATEDHPSAIVFLKTRYGPEQAILI